MKKALLIMFGFIGFAFVVGLGVAVFYLMPKTTPVPAPVSPAADTSYQPPDFAEGKSFVDFEATIHVPEPLKHLVTPSGVVIYGSIFKFENMGATSVNEWADLFDLAPEPTAAFPRKVRFHADKVKLLKVLGGLSSTMFLRIDGCFDDVRVPCFPLNERRMNLRVARKLTEAELNSGKPVQLGDLYFTRELPQGHWLTASTTCDNPSSTVNGKVTPTADFLAKMPKNKKAALYVVPGLTKGMLARQAVRNEKQDLWPFVFHAEFFTPSEKSHNFAFPFSKITSPDYITAFVAFCDEKDDLRSCVNPHFPGFYPVSEDGLGFQLVAEGLRFSYCNTANFVLHSFPPIKEGDKPVLGKTRNPALPGEIVEGQLL